MNTKTFTKTLLMSLLFTALLAVQGRADGVVKREINENWTFKQARGHNWYPATVPGVVHTDLMDNRIIEDPFFRLNERGVQWVDKEDWVYKTILNIPSDIFEKDRIELHFKGLDTYADVFFNDSCILKANNMFREWRVDVKSLVKAEGNELRVYFRSPLKEDIPKFNALPYQNEAGNDQSENGGVFDKKVSVFARKAAYHYGWDWGPRLVTSGIWRPVYLVGWNEARIENVHYIRKSVTAQRAQVTVRVETFADKPVETTVQVAVAGVKNNWQVTRQLQKGTNVVELDITVDNPKLWWTNGLGEAHLYAFTTSLSSSNRIIDSCSANVGLRDLKLIREKDAAGHTFYFRLNGVKVFAKGANYVPQDNFLPRVTDAQYEKTVTDAVDANMNMLRVWGGGIYENDIFYELCDKHGILVWQDFMFACSTYPMNPEMLENIRQEAIDNVKRLRNHACIAIWCGNNENHAAWFAWGWMPKYKQAGVLDEMRKDYKDLFHELLPEVTAQYDSATFYWPSSPYAGNPDARSETGKANWNPDGDAHYWGVWHAKDSIANFNIIRARFFSEYGFQSFPEYQSVLKYAPEERDHDIFSEVMMAHQRGGIHANGLIEWYLLNEYRKPADFVNFLYTGQILQGDAIKTAIEAHRRDMPYCMGSLFWQHNDCWPVASWSSRDYYGRWKAQHYFAKKAYRNILVSPIAKDGKLDVYAVSDEQKVTKGKLRIRVMDLRGKILFEKNSTVTVPANSSKALFSTSPETVLKGTPPNEALVNAAFTDSKGEVYSNNYFLSRYKDINFPEAHIKTSSVSSPNGIDLTVESDVVTRGVFLSINGIDNFFSDNYFDLLPGEPVTVHVTTDLDKATFDKQLKVESLNQLKID
ncbi:MAG: glycoside hydrolase family 2 protein [Prevotellaceae bacterium]|jgi:beta-mannosidase|nr:glycoside hydrolase family 2 protein [Prevotellaceae bacterium]